MFKSNFPVDRQALTYPVVWNAFQFMLLSSCCSCCSVHGCRLPDAEQYDLSYGTLSYGTLSYGTATRVYGLT